MDMATTIQVSDDLLKTLKKRKLHEKESYEEIIWDLLEDTMELSEETLKSIERAKKGRFYTHKQVKERLGL